MERDPKVPPTQNLLSKYENKRERKVIEKQRARKERRKERGIEKVETGQAVARQREKKGRASIALADIRGAPGWQNK